jgi:hypothetical protein
MSDIDRPTPWVTPGEDYGINVNVCPQSGKYIELAEEANRLRKALERIANTNPHPRPDGTYNISREALIQIAQKALRSHDIEGTIT